MVVVVLCPWHTTISSCLRCWPEFPFFAIFGGSAKGSSSHAASGHGMAVGAVRVVKRCGIVRGAWGMGHGAWGACIEMED